MFALTSQTRRYATSIPANIAEGCGRNSDRELGRFLSIAMGSANELEYHLILAHDLRYISVGVYSDVEEKLNEVKRMLSGFLLRVRNDSRRKREPIHITDSELEARGSELEAL